jgi:hypothetical protein
MKAILAHFPSAFVSGLTLFERHCLREAYFEQELSDPQSVSLLQPDWKLKLKTMVIRRLENGWWKLSK